MASRLGSLKRRLSARRTATEPPVAPPPLDAAAIEALAADATRVAAAEGSMAGVDVLRGVRGFEPHPQLDALELRLRHEAFAELDDRSGRTDWPPRADDLFTGERECPEVGVAQLDVDRLASAIVNHGCLLVRGLVSPSDAAHLVEVIDESFHACDTPKPSADEAWRSAWHHPFDPGPPYPAPAKGHRGWVRSAGGVLAADSPPAFAAMMRAFERAKLPDIVEGYFGEQPVLSVDKCTLRRVPLDLGGAEWHQDGSFLGEGIRTLNIWVALSECGGEVSSPGLDVVPRRFDAVLPTGTDGAFFDWSVGPDLVAREAIEAPVVRPRFQAGDALLFDELFLHRTAIEPTMTQERYAIECWCFAGSSYPGGTTPIVF